MKKLLLLLLPLLIACGGRDTTTNAKTDTAALQATPTATTATNEAGQELTIAAPELTAKSGDNICVDMQVLGFDKLLSMQYTLTWNKSVLEFKELKNFNLPYLDQGDFGLHLTANGMLTCAWIDESLKGATVADNASIYQVCFLVKGKAGENSYLKITDRPTSIEVVNLREQLIPLKKKTGSVTIE